MLKKYFIISLLFLAYMIVVGHELIPHDHYDDDHVTEQHNKGDNGHDDDHESNHFLFAHSYLIFHNSRENDIIFLTQNTTDNDVKTDHATLAAITPVINNLFTAFDTTPAYFPDTGDPIPDARIESAGDRAPPASILFS